MLERPGGVQIHTEERMIGRELPDAHVVAVDDGFISRPDQVGEVVCRITAPSPAERA
jgi:hypothetical protein